MYSRFAERRLPGYCDLPSSELQGIVAIQLHNHPEVIPLLMKRLCEYLTRQPDQEFYTGKLFVAEPHRIRVRT